VRYARLAGLLFIVLGLLLVGYALFEGFGGRIYQAWRGRELDRTLESLPPRAAPRVDPYQPGSAIGRLEIPRLGLSVVVLEGSDAGTLRLGVGRLPNSALPGDPGNVVLAGHRDTFFRSLREIRPGDRISLRTPEGTFPYTVDWTTVVNPTDTSVLLPTPAPSLTLVTCYPFYYIGSAPRRFIVRARPPQAVADATPMAAKAPPTRAAPVPVRRHSRVRAASVPVRAPAAAPPVRVVAAVAAAPPPSAEDLVETAVPPADSPPVAQEPAPPASPPPAPPRQHGIRGVFHKLAGVFSARRAKLQ
jgi:sortase A